MVGTVVGVSELLRDNEAGDGYRYSTDHTYRYEFRRRWDDGSGKTVAWVMLNPATGDTDGKGRPTLRRIVGFSKQWGYGGLAIVNLFAYRATKPADLEAAPDPVGPDNDATILRVTDDAELVVCAWGHHGALHGRSREVVAMLDDPMCLGTTRRGEPRHPLYVARDAALVPLAMPPG